MASPANPADTRAYIVERLVGDTGEPDQVINAGRSLGVRALPLIVEALGQAFAVPLGMELKTVEVARFTQARPEDPTSTAMTIAASLTSPDAMTFVLDGAAIAVLISAVFGADPDQPIAPVTRTLSPTELEVASTVFTTVAEVLNGSGERAFNLRFPLASAINGAEIKKLVLRDGPGVRLQFSISAPGGRGTLEVMMPQRVLLKHRGDAVASAEQGSEWRSRFNEEVMRSAVSLEAHMPLGTLTLGDIAELQEGQILEFIEGAQSAATLSSKGKTLFVCEFGRLNQNYTVRIKHPFDAEQDLIDTLIPA